MSITNNELSRNYGIRACEALIFYIDKILLFIEKWKSMNKKTFLNPRQLESSALFHIPSLFGIVKLFF